MDWNRLKHSIGLCLCLSGVKRAQYLKKHKVLAGIGDNCMVMFRKVPLYPELITLGDNVWIASNVSFITHDVIHRMLNNCLGSDLKENRAPITIGNHVFIGANSSILPGVNIGDHTIVAAGSVISKDIQEGVYAGVPAKFICSFDEFVRKRSELE